MSKAKRGLPKALRMPLLVNSKLVEEDAVLQLLQAKTKEKGEPKKTHRVDLDEDKPTKKNKTT